MLTKSVQFNVMVRENITFLIGSGSSSLLDFDGSAPYLFLSINSKSLGVVSGVLSGVVSCGLPANIKLYLNLFILGGHIHCSKF